MTKDKRKKRKKKGKKKAAETTPEDKNVDGREAARALKKALAEADEKEKKERAKKERRDPTAKTKLPERRKTHRRRRPPTSIGPAMPRPERREPKTKPEPKKPGLERPPFHRRHDLFVVILGLAVIAAGAVLSQRLGQAAPRRFDRLGVSFNRPAVFLPPRVVTPPGDEKAGDGTELPYHVVYQSPADPRVKLEVLVDRRPRFNNLRAARALDRASVYGDMVWLASSGDIKIKGRLWARAEYKYAFKSGDFDSPKVATAIESATLNGELLYVVTFHGGPRAAQELANAVIPTLSIDPNHPAAQPHKE